MKKISFGEKYKEILNIIWDYNKNEINPFEISYKSSKKIWIKCLEKDYHGSYEISCNKFYNGRRCSYCGTKKVHPLDSFGELHKEELDMIWDYEKNEINPFEISPKSSKKIWIKCLEKDYHGSYKISCINFTNGNRCSYCSSTEIHNLDSFGEVYKEILDKTWDYEKNKIDMYTLARHSKQKVWMKCTEKDYHGSYEISCSKFSSGRRCPYCASKKVHPLDSFGERHKEILDKIWDYEKNDIDPYKLSPNAKKKIWIKCLKKDYHESYEISCLNFTSGNRCSYCRGFKVHKLDSFGYKHENILPHIWDYDKNQIDPYEITCKSGKEVRIKCIEKSYHESYKIKVCDYAKGNRCPYCVSKKIHRLDSFGAKYEEILDKIWDYKKNTVDPYEISLNNSKEIWINCLEKEYHGSYKIKVCDYTKGNRCPYCVNAKVHRLDSFGQLHKEILDKIWDYEKNEIDPFSISPSTNRKVWIKCLEKDYHGSYSISCGNYTYGFRCSYCGTQKVHRLDSFGERHKEILDNVWDCEKNKVNPFTLAEQSHKKYWFKCSIHGSYERSLSGSIRAEFRCPNCSIILEESILQSKVKTYLNELGYNILHEQFCNLRPNNPKTGGWLRYDNEIEELDLIIEVHGKQHYKYSDILFFKTYDEFIELQERDLYKKEYAIKNGYNYLEIPYYTEKKDEYKNLIDSKIYEIKHKDKDD